MDAWSAEQLKRMQLGGNDALNNFLKRYGVDKHTDIKEKYNSPGAEVRSAQSCCIRDCFLEQHTFVKPSGLALSSAAHLAA